MATPRQAQAHLDTPAGPVLVRLTTPGSPGHGPLVLVPGVTSAVIGERLAQRLARAGFAVAWWGAAAPEALTAAAAWAADRTAAGPDGPSRAVLRLPEAGLPPEHAMPTVAWPGPAPDPADPVALDTALDLVVRRLVALVP